jgi:hypothetical protein
MPNLTGNSRVLGLSGLLDSDPQVPIDRDRNLFTTLLRLRMHDLILSKLYYDPHHPGIAAMTSRIPPR